MVTRVDERENAATQLQSPGAPDTMPVLARGTLVTERFVVRDVAGAGGMGVVYCAEDLVTGSLAAVKVLMRCSAEERARFDREVQVLAGLAHPATVRYLGHGSIGGHPFLAMEWLEGVDLSRRLAEGPLEIAETLKIARRVAEALAEAHVHGIVHRDIKPSNLFLPGGDVLGVRVLDFGLAREERPRDNVTHTGTMLGTPGYMAPEQARGASVDARSDVFALGCVLYECIAGVPAFGRPTLVDAIAAVLSVEPPRLRALRSDVPIALDDLIARMLHKEPSQRPADAGAVLEALAHLPLDLTIDGLRHEVRVTKSLPASARLAWGFLADSDRWERLVGAPRTQYSFEPVGIGGSIARIGEAELFAMPLRWQEVGEWVEGSMGCGERRFLGGPFESLGLAIEIAPSADGCVVEGRAFAVVRPGAAEGAAQMVLGHFEKRLHLYLDTLAAILAQQPDAHAPLDAEASPCTIARRITLKHPGNRVLGGRRTHAASEAFEARAEAYMATASNPACAKDLIELLRHAPDDQLRRMRPGELADTLEVDRRTMLRALLQAVRVGLLDLARELVCPSCRVGVELRSGAADAGGSGGCALCRIEFDVDLATNVEPVFSLAGVAGAVSQDVYCTGSPTFRPHVMAQMILARGERRTVRLPLPASGVRLRARTSRQLWDAIDVPRAGAIEATIGAAVLTIGEVHGSISASDASSVTIENASGTELVVTLERVHDGDAMPAAALLTCPEIVDLYASDPGAIGVGVSVQTLVVLLVETMRVAEACERLGDGRALALVREQMEMARAVVADAAGAIVRQRGDVTMACFASIPAAEKAFATLAERLATHCTTHDAPLQIRGAITEGTFLAVATVDGIELFGRTLRRGLDALPSVDPAHARLIASAGP